MWEILSHQKYSSNLHFFFYFAVIAFVFSAQQMLLLQGARKGEGESVLWNHHQKQTFQGEPLPVTARPQIQKWMQLFHLWSHHLFKRIHQWTHRPPAWKHTSLWKITHQNNCRPKRIIQEFLQMPWIKYKQCYFPLFIATLHNNATINSYNIYFRRQ